jgi:hypothetical protein
MAFSAAGGRIESDGAFTGTFRGPSAVVIFNPTRFSTYSGDDPTAPTATFGSITVDFNDSTIAFDPETHDTTSAELFGGAVRTSTVSFIDGSGVRQAATVVDLSPSNVEELNYSGAAIYEARLANGAPQLIAMMTFGGDSSFHTPSGGVAEFAFATFGYFNDEQGGGLTRFYGEGALTVDFSTGQVTGTIADLDFNYLETGEDPLIVNETTQAGLDFGLQFFGALNNGSIRGGASTVGDVFLSGSFTADLFGPAGGGPREIAGAYGIDQIGLGYSAYGIFQGAVDPFEVGASQSGGVVTDRGFQGEFRGPFSSIEIDEEFFAIFIGEPTSPGDEFDVVLDIDGAVNTGAEPVITISVYGVDHTFDFALSGEIGPPSVDWFNARVTLDTKGDTLMSLFSLETGDRQPQYSGLAAFINPSASGEFDPVELFTSFGADQVSLPNAGVATFTTGFFGSYSEADGATTLFISQNKGSFEVDFGDGSVVGSSNGLLFADSGGSWNGTTEGGATFNLHFVGAVVGDDFSGTVETTGAPMNGFFYGDFYGPLNGAPQEIGGAFGLAGDGGAAHGGFIGIRD